MTKIIIDLPNRLTKITESCGRCSLLSREPDEIEDWCKAFQKGIERKHVNSGGIRQLRCPQCMYYEEPKVKRIMMYLEKVFKKLKLKG